MGPFCMYSLKAKWGKQAFIWVPNGLKPGVCPWTHIIRLYVRHPLLDIRF